MKYFLTAIALTAILALTPASLLAQSPDRPTTATPQPGPGSATIPGAGQPASPAGTGAPSGSSNPAAGATEPPADAFISLTQLPGISEVNNELVNADSLPDLFNSLYRMCIGAAAVIAVIQIMRAGVKFMTKGGSVSANTEAKDMIRNAIFGLVLVLSPAIVFGIINPRILNLELSLSELEPTNLTDVDLTGSQSQMCKSSEKFQAVTISDGGDVAGACKALGDGWIGKEDACCAAANAAVRTGQRCCGYEPSTIKPPTPPREDARGTYSYDYVVRDTNYDTGQACSTFGSRNFGTEEQCLTDANGALPPNNQGAIRNRCRVASGITESYTPSKTVFDQINSLPACP